MTGGKQVYKIIAEHWITGERKVLQQSLFKDVLEQTINFHKENNSEYKIWIE